MSWSTVSRSMIGMVAAVLAVGTFGAVGSQPASGTNWFGKTGLYGDCTTPNQADNKTHSVGYNSVDLLVSWNHGWVNTNVIDPTAVDTVYHSTIQANTDLVALDGYYSTYCGEDWYSAGGGVIGHTSCHSITGAWGSDCQKHQARYDLGYVEDSTDGEIRCLIAHEAGHSLGLAHRSGSVMESGACPSVQYSTHDRGHLTNDLDN